MNPFIKWTGGLFWKKYSNVFETLWQEHLEVAETELFYNARSQGYIDIKKVFQNTAEGEARLATFVREHIYSPAFADAPNDVKVWLIAQTVNKYLTYISDSSQYGKVEYWQSPGEILARKKDDCDGYAVLIKWLCDYAGIPSWRTMVAVTDAYTGRIVLKNKEASFSGGKWAGHAVLLYIRETDNMPYPVEGSLLPEECLVNYGKFVPFWQNPRYGVIKWATTQEKTFSKDPTDRFIEGFDTKK